MTKKTAPTGPLAFTGCEIWCLCKCGQISCGCHQGPVRR